MKNNDLYTMKEISAFIEAAKKQEKEDLLKAIDTLVDLYLEFEIKAKTIIDAIKILKESVDK